MKLFKDIFVGFDGFKLIFVLLLFLNCQGQQHSVAIEKIEEPRTYVANFADSPIEIDGVGNEKVWQNAKTTASFIDIEGVKKPKYDTTLKMLWDKDNLYFLAEMEEPHVWGTLKQRDTIIFHNNDFEIFIDPDGDSHNYYELEFNVLNTVWDLFLTKPYRDDPIVLNDWDARGLKSAVHIDGTLNNANDTDKKWTLEVAIPLNVFKASYFENTDLSNTFWRMNFSRVHWDFDLKDGRYTRKLKSDGELALEYNWVWSPQGVIAMHQPETWGYVFFASNDVESKDFTIPKDEKIKWKLFELYRAQKAYFEKNDQWSKSIAKLKVNTIVDKKDLNPLLENHSTGWNIIVKSPYTNKTLIIREDGKFTSK